MSEAKVDRAGDSCVAREPEPEIVRTYLAHQRAADESHRVTLSHRSQMHDIMKRARLLVIAGRKITGHPKHGTPVETGSRLVHRKKWGWVFEIQVEHYCGEGTYEVDEKPIVFPARWLEMPDEQWQAELRACAASREARDEARLRKMQEESARAQEAAERKMLAQLTTKYGGPNA